jgi:hypothetical protein
MVPSSGNNEDFGFTKKLVSKKTIVKSKEECDLDEGDTLEYCVIDQEIFVMR